VLSPPANRGLPNAFEVDAGESGSQGVSAVDLHRVLAEVRREREREQIEEVISR
jgi:hypothetical protein